MSAPIRTADHERLHHILVAHGLLLGIAACILFPSGAILLKLCRFRRGIWVHVACQISGLMAAVAGFGTGIYLCEEWHKWGAYNGHTILGTIVICVWILQPLSGMIHHAMFKKVLKTTPYGVAHRWIGRVAVVAGIVNGGLGIQLVDHSIHTHSTKEKIAYGVVAGVFGLLWITTIVWCSACGKEFKEMSGDSTPLNDETSVLGESVASDKDVEKGAAA